MTTSLYKVIRLPTLSAADTGIAEEAAIVSSSRDFRLEALKTSPKTFASRYEEEVLVPVEATRQQHSHPLASHYVGVPRHGEHTDAWAGYLLMYGPQVETRDARATFHFHPLNEAGQEDSVGTTLEHAKEMSAKERCLYHHLSGLFVGSQARGQGLGEALIRMAMEDANHAGLASGAVEVRHTIALDTDNTNAMRLYQKCGFLTKEEGMYKPKPMDGKDQAEKGYTIMECLISLAET